MVKLRKRKSKRQNHPRDRRKSVVRADNARPHVAKRVKQYLEDNNLKSAPHPPYSPDLAPSDFFLFDHVKRLLQGTELQTAEELLDAVVRILADIPFETLMATFHEWLQRLQALTVMENRLNKHSLIQKTSVEFQRETEILRGGLNTMYVPSLQA
jgi:transposase